MMRFRKNHRRKRGMSLLAVIVALAIGIPIVLFVGQLLSRSFKEQKHYELESDLVSLRTYVLKTFDCSSTVATLGTACSTGGFVQVKSRRAATPTLIKTPDLSTSATDSHSRIGEWALRASCADCATCSGGKQLLVEAAHATSLSSDRKDALTGKSLGWQNLFRDIPLGCRIP